MQSSVFILLLYYLGWLFLPALNFNLAAQTRVDLRNQSSNVDFTGASTTKPIRMDITLPASCAVGEFFFRRVSATDGLLFSCLATDVWTQQGTPPTQSVPSGSLLYTDGINPTWTQLGGDLNGSPANLQVVKLRSQPISTTVPQTGQALVWTGTEWAPQFGAGQSTITVKSGATTVSTNGVANLVAGSGISISLTPVSGETQIQHTVDTGVIETRSRAQSGASLLCSSPTLDGFSFTCVMSPVPTSLSTGMLIHWQPTAQGTGGATSLSIGALSAIAIKLADGSTDPSAADIAANQIYPIWFDGTVFRMITSNPVVAQATVSRPACEASLRGRIWHVFGAAETQDTVAICAKDATDLYDWRTLY
jgi:hypothetical protein